MDAFRSLIFLVIAPPVVAGVGPWLRRNPMYVAVGSIIVGHSLGLGQTALLGYAAVFGATVFAVARLYEERTLARQFGGEYDAYRRAVPGWRPRLRPWRR
jgi:protein-S-isoprenylcysteine O-methyltransferase Ste14